MLELRVVELRGKNDYEEVIIKDSQFVTEIKKNYKTHKDELKNLLRKLSNNHVLDGANETVRIGRMKFEGSNMLIEDMTEAVEYYKTYEVTEQEAFVFSLYEFQKIFEKVKRAINKYCSDRDIKKMKLV